MLFCCLWAVHLFRKVCFPEQNGKGPVLRYKKQGSGDYCYDICEIFYICRSRQMSPKRILRLLFDEMQPLAKVDPKGDALLHQIMEKCWELYYYGDESKEEQNLKKQLQEIADQNKLVWKTEKNVSDPCDR